MTHLSTPARRICLALAVSAIAHAAVLWFGPSQTLHEKMQLPPLNAKLESMPQPAALPAAQPTENWQRKPGINTSSQPPIQPVDTLKVMKKSPVIDQFPKHVQLNFNVFRGADMVKTSEVLHRLDIKGDRYKLTAIRQTTGLSNLLNYDRLIQTSSGKLEEDGLHPEIFKQTTQPNDEAQELESIFDWVNKSARFSNGHKTALTGDTQDSLSFMYQFSQLTLFPLHREFFTMSISDGSQLNPIRIEINGLVDTTTPLGKMRTLHLRKMHPKGEAYFELWLALEYHLLPVKLRQFDGSNFLTEEVVVSDIRVGEDYEPDVP
jgi:hypothetical protein